MRLDFIPWIGVVILAAASTSLLITRDWRWGLSMLAAQYLGAFALVGLTWPLTMAAVKLITGWIATAALGMTRLGLPLQEAEHEPRWLQGRTFRLFGAGIVILMAFAATPSIRNLIPGIGLPVAAGSLILMGAGLLQLGMTSQILRVVVGLLTLLCGFEILYGSVESSILVAGLLAIIDLGLALTGSYLLLNSIPPEEKESL